MLSNNLVNEDKKQVVDAYLSYQESKQLSESFINHFANISNHIEKVKGLFKLPPKRFLAQIDDIVEAIDSLNKSSKYSEKVIRALHKGAERNDV